MGWMSIYFHFVPFFGEGVPILLVYQPAHTMKHRKMKPLESPETRPIPRFNKIIVVENNQIGHFINESVIKAVSISKEIERMPSASAMLEFLHNIQRLDEVPELIFLDLESTGCSEVEFIRQFQTMSDFVRNKCKIIIIAEKLSQEEMLALSVCPSIIKIIIKPLDVFQLRDFI